VALKEGQKFVGVIVPAPLLDRADALVRRRG